MPGSPAEPGGRSLGGDRPRRDRKSTRLNSSHPSISYAVFCLKKKNELKNTINDMVDRLRVFVDEVTRVANYVCTGDILGGKATVPVVPATLKILTENVNART